MLFEIKFTVKGYTKKVSPSRYHLLMFAGICNRLLFSYHALATTECHTPLLCQ